MSHVVTQDDREAAASIAIFPELAARLRAGELDDHQSIQAFARHLTPAPAGDVRIVPVEPTQAMREAGEDILAQNGCLVLPEEMADVWSAMLTASITTDIGGADGKDGPAFEALERFLTDHEGNDETAEGQDVDRLARRAVTNLRGVVSAALAVCHSATDDCRSGRIVTIDPDAFDYLNASLDKVGDSSAVSGSAEGLREALWKRACEGREGYCSSDLQDAAKWAIGEALRLAERAARSAALPDHYEWSAGNREKFEFGRDTAADNIAALTEGQQS